jgi:hypothetical protein
MATPAGILAALLISKNVASSSSSWPVKVGGLAEAPDAQISLYDTPGRSPNPKFLLDFPTAMVMVRGPKSDYAAGYLKAVQVKDALLGIDPYDHTDGRVDGITLLSDVSFLNNDDNGRPLFSINIQLIFEPVTNALTQRESL